MNDQLLSKIPGFVLGDKIDPSDYDATKNGVMGLRQFLYALHMWLIDIVIPHPQGEPPFQFIPAERWEEGRREEEPDFLESADSLDIILRIRRPCRVSHKGANYEGLYYNSPELAGLKERIGSKFDAECKVDPAHLGIIYVRKLGTEEWVKCYSLNWDYTNGLSLHRHLLYKKHAIKTYGRKRAGVKEYIRAMIELAELIRASVNVAMGLFDHQLLARFLGVNSDNLIRQDLYGNLLPSSGIFAGQNVNPFAPAPDSSGTADTPPVPPESPTETRAGDESPTRPQPPPISPRRFGTRNIGGSASM